MADASDIREHMDVVGSDGAPVGAVDRVEDGRIRLTRRGSVDDLHRHVPLSAVARVDDRVHLNMTAAAVLEGAAVSAAAGEAPPLRNRQAGGAPRRNFYLPWLLGAVGLILLFALFRSCVYHKEAELAGATDTQPAVVGRDGLAAAPAAEPGSLAGELGRYLAGNEPTPRTFRFDRLNFDPGSAAIRAADQADVDALARVLAAHPKARGRVVGYADARGTGPANARLGEERAQAVVRALEAKGVTGRVTAASGGEGNPTAGNGTPQGRFENRRTELVIEAK